MKQRSNGGREGLSFAVVVKDKEGRVLQRISAPSRSFVQQWNQIVSVQAAQAARTIKKTDGDNYSLTPYKYNLNANSTIGETSYGIRVGKGFTAVAIDDYALEIPCEEGTGVDEFEHQTFTMTVPTTLGGTRSFTLKRIMINKSGAPIDVKEIGIYVRYGNFLAVRDVLPGAVTVPDGGSITVIYTFAATV